MGFDFIVPYLYCFNTGPRCLRYYLQYSFSLVVFYLQDSLSLVAFYLQDSLSSVVFCLQDSLSSVVFYAAQRVLGPLLNQDPHGPPIGTKQRIVNISDYTINVLGKPNELPSDEFCWYWHHKIHLQFYNLFVNFIENKVNLSQDMSSGVVICNKS